MTSPYYSPSGRLSFSAILFTVLAILAAVPVAFIYGWIRTNAPLIMHFFFAFFLALCLALLTSWAAARGKVRNPRRMAKLGWLIGGAGWYCQWVAYSAFALQNTRLSSGSLLADFANVLAHPVYPIGVAAGLLQAGAGEIAGWRIGGWAFFLSWLVELFLLLGLPHLYGRIRAGEPFCEDSGSWAEKIEFSKKFAFIETAEAAVRTLEKEPEALFSLLSPWSDGGPLSYSKVTLYRCTCGGDPFISISNIHATSNGRRVNETPELLVQFLRLPGYDAQTVIDRIEQLEPQPTFSTSHGAATPPELLGAVEAAEAGRFEAALAAAAPYVHAAEDNLRTDAVRLSALATAHLGRWGESLNFWDKLFSEEPTAYNALQLAASLAMTGDLRRGEEWVTKARQMNAASHELPEISILTTFVSALTQCGEVKSALPYLDEIKNVYVSLGVTDSTFLTLRGVPFFSGFLHNSAAVIRGALSREQGEAWYRAMLPHLDESGKEELSAWLETTFIPETKAAGE